MKKKEKKGGKLMIRHASRFDVFLSMLIMLEVSQVNGGMRIIDQGLGSLSTRLGSGVFMFPDV